MKKPFIATVIMAGLFYAASIGLAAEPQKTSGGADGATKKSEVQAEPQKTSGGADGATKKSEVQAEPQKTSGEADGAAKKSKADVVKKPEAQAQTDPRMMLSVPLFSDRFSTVPLALVNGEPISLRDFLGALGMAHEGQKEAKKLIAKADYPLLLDRLINVKLMVQDARTMGMADLPEIQDEMKTFSKSALTELLLDDVTKDVKAPEDAVQKLYKEMVREWKIKSVMFAKEDDAKKMAEEIKAGKNFDEAVAKALEDKLAEGSKEGGYVKPDALLPAIVDVVSKMDVGTVSGVIKLDLGKKEPGYVILKLEDVRYPDDEKTKEKARAAVLSGQQKLAVNKFNVELRKKYLKINNKLIKSLDFESPKPGFEKLSKDKRVLVEVRKGKPVTVADLAAAYKKKYFHGLELAIKSKKVNSLKLEMLGEMLQDRLYGEEAVRRGIDKSQEYKDRLREHEDSLLFGTYVSKVLVPNLKIEEKDLKAYYEGHKKDYTFPEMMRVESLVFAKVADAEEALKQLKQGADLKWMKSNMEGQLPKDTPGLQSFEGNMVMVTEMPKGVQKALSGARPDDVRLYQSPEGHFYVLYVKDVSPAKEQSYEEVRGLVFNKVYDSKLQNAVEDWAGKLKAAGTVDIYLASPEKDTEISKAK